jgi:hypothetical protein
MMVDLNASRMWVVGVLCLAAAVGWGVFGDGEEDGVVGEERVRISERVRERPRVDRLAVPRQADEQPVGRLRAWAAGMTDEELAEMVRRVWAEVPEDGTEPDPATKTLLCVLFREWGGRDADEAFAVFAALQDARGGGGENSVELRRSTEALVFAIWAGYGERDPAGAWEVLDGEESTVRGSIRASTWVGSREAVATLDMIVRKLLEQSPEKVLEAAEGNHPFRSEAVRAWLANVDDPTERVELFLRWVNGYEQRRKLEKLQTSSVTGELSVEWRDSRGFVAHAMAGLAEGDPEQIWDALPERFEGVSFVGLWSRSKPEDALAFFETKIGEEAYRRYASDLVLALLPTHPEQAISFLSRLGELERTTTELIVMLGEFTQWPVVEGMRPGIPMDELRQRAEQAMENHASELRARIYLRFTLGLDK